MWHTWKISIYISWNTFWADLKPTLTYHLWPKIRQVSSSPKFHMGDKNAFWILGHHICVCAYVMFTLLFKSHKHTYMYEWQFTLILPSTIKCLPHKAYITQCINLRILIVDCVLQVFKWLDEFILCFISCRTVAAWENIGVDQQATYSA